MNGDGPTSPPADAINSPAKLGPQDNITQPTAENSSETNILVDSLEERLAGPEPNARGVLKDLAKIGKVERFTPLTGEEINSIRTDEEIREGTRYTYPTKAGTVTTLVLSPDLRALPQEKKNEILSFLRASREEEGYRYEGLIVNSLLKQLEIERKFGLPPGSLFRELKLNVADYATSLLDQTGTLYWRVLEKHADFLKSNGASDDQMVTEIAGHVFHEAVHDPDEELAPNLFNGKSSFGEVSSVTAQMAYYLDEGYSGPTAYDVHDYHVGAKKVQNGENNDRDYDVATYAGAILLRDSLREIYGEHFSDTEKMDPLNACRHVIKALSTEERQQLIPTLRKAIERSADREVFSGILAQTTKQDQEIEDNTKVT